MELFRLILIFVFGSFIGWLFEYLVFHKNPSWGILQHIFNLKHVHVPMLPIYGVGFIILYWIKLFNLNTLTKILLATLSINLLECTLGLLSYRFYGFQTWKYSSSDTCHGYISICTGLVWMIFISIFYICI